MPPRHSKLAQRAFPRLSVPWPNGSRRARGAYRIATWNIGKKYAPDALLYLFLHGNIDYLAIQEPSHWRKDSTIVKLMEAAALSAGIHLYISKHTLVLMNAHRLGNRITKHESLHDGRIQSHLCQFSNDKHVLFINAYAYQNNYSPSPENSAQLHSPLNSETKYTRLSTNIKPNTPTSNSQSPETSKQP